MKIGGRTEPISELIGGRLALASLLKPAGRPVLLPEQPVERLLQPVGQHVLPLEQPVGQHVAEPERHVERPVEQHDAGLVSAEPVSVLVPGPVLAWTTFHLWWFPFRLSRNPRQVHRCRLVAEGHLFRLSLYPFQFQFLFRYRYLFPFPCPYPYLFRCLFLFRCPDLELGRAAGGTAEDC